MSSLNLTQASHLARRVGFSAQSSIVDTLMLQSSKEAAIESIFSLPAIELPLPDWHNSAPLGRSQDEDIKKQNRQTRNRWSRELKYWWFKQMIANTSPIQEKMTLFWANHFTSSLKKVKWPPALLAQNRLFREHATGNFRDLLAGILRDPAMLLYLDNATSKKNAPNENFARELLELFTMGEGSFSEQDVKEMARALTGASINRKTGQYAFKRRTHDNDEKTIFGQTAAFTPNDIADLILQQPEVAPFITEKLWRFFVGSTPQENTITELALVLVNNNYELKPLLKALLSTEEFWLDQGNLIKSPMELLVGSTQLFELPIAQQKVFLRATKAMGQDLFDPPTVKGWSGGKAWYNTSTLATREQVVLYVLNNLVSHPTQEQMLAATSVAQLPDPEHSDYLQLILHDPAYQVA